MDGNRERVLRAHAELADLVERDTYTSAMKARMLNLVDDPGLTRTNESADARLRMIRGAFLRRSRSGEVAVVANGRADWIGWFELKTETE